MSLTKPMNLDAGVGSRSVPDDATGGKKAKKPKPHQPSVPILATVQEFFSNVLGLDLALMFRWAQNNLSEKNEKETEAEKHVKKLQKELRKLGKAQNKKPTREGHQGMRKLKLQIADAQDQLRNAEIFSKVQKMDEHMTELEEEMKAMVANLLEIRAKEDPTSSDKTALTDLKKLIKGKKNQYTFAMKQKEDLEQQMSNMAQQPQAMSSQTMPSQAMPSQAMPSKPILSHARMTAHPLPPLHLLNYEYRLGDHPSVQRTGDWVEAHKSPEQVKVEKFISESPLDFECGDHMRLDSHANDVTIRTPSFSRRGAAAQTRDQIALKIALLQMTANRQLNSSATNAFYDDDLKWRLDEEGRAKIMHRGPYTDLVMAEDRAGCPRPVLLLRKCFNDEVMCCDDMIIRLQQQFAREGQRHGCSGLVYLEESTKYHHAALVLETYRRT